MGKSDKTKADRDLAELREEVAQLRAAAQEREALEPMRDAVGQLSSLEDIERVTAAMCEGFELLGISFRKCEINLVDDTENPRSVEARGTHGREAWEEVDSHGEASAKVLQFWREQKVVHRKDLATEDVYGEAKLCALGVRSVIDVPFSHGTLAVNSSEAHAFSPANIQTFQVMATLLSQAFARMQELHDLERRNLELEETQRQLNAVHEITKEALSALRAEQILDSLGTQIVEVGFFRSLMIAVVDREHQRVEVRRNFLSFQDGVFHHDSIKAGGLLAHVPIVRHGTPGQEVRRDETIVGTSYPLDDDNVTAQVARTGEMQVIGGWDDRFDERLSDPDYHKDGKISYFIPVIYEGRTVAVLATGSERGEKEATLRRIEAMQPLLDQVAIALVHSRLYEELTGEIEERRKVEEALREEEGRLLTAQRIAGMGFLEQNLITGEMYWSDEVFRLYGVDPAAEPTMELALSLVHPDDREAVSKALQVATEGGEPHDMDHRMMRPDGTVIWVHGQTELVRDSEGNPERLLGTTVDITERRQSEQAILASSPLIALGEMSAAMGHELSQPLTVISAQAEGVELRLKRGMEIDQEQQLTWSTNTQECVERMRALLDHLRLFSQDRSREAKESVSLNDAVHGALFLTEAQLRSRGIELALSLGKDLSPILGDLYRLEQVLVNLISNARNALVEKQEEIARMQGGSAGREDWAMRLDIRTRQEGSELVAEVADNGTGVSGEYRSRIFDPFFTTRAQDRGTGLGLAISHAIVTDHAGVIECESREGGGTLFRVRLPVPA